MRVAIALLCHKNIEQINTLLKAMEHEEVYFFIHVDKKSELDREMIHGQNAQVLSKDESIDIQWGGYGMIEATLLLLRKIALCTEQFNYVWLMSGQDYPLHSIERILSILETSEQEDYIEILPDEVSYSRGYWKRNQLVYPKWMVSNFAANKIAKHLLWLITGGRKNTFSVIRRKVAIEKFYFGSQWWLLKSETIAKMLGYLEDHTWYMDFYKQSLVPDESFFQTLFGIVCDSSQAKGTKCYVNWKEDRNSPEVLTSDDKELIDRIKKQFLIARKVDFEIDKSITNYMIGTESESVS